MRGGRGPRSLLPRHPRPGREDLRDPCPRARSTGEHGPPPESRGRCGLEKAPLGSGEGGQAKCLVYESGEERRQSCNACHKLLSSRSNKLKGGAAIIMLPRQHPDRVPSDRVSPELSVSWAGGTLRPIPAPPQQLPDGQQLFPRALSPPGPRGPAPHPAVESSCTGERKGVDVCACERLCECTCASWAWVCSGVRTHVRV